MLVSVVNCCVYVHFWASLAEAQILYTLIFFFFFFLMPEALFFHFTLSSETSGNVLLQSNIISNVSKVASFYCLILLWFTMFPYHVSVCSAASESVLFCCFTCSAGFVFYVYAVRCPVMIGYVIPCYVPLYTFTHYCQSCTDIRCWKINCDKWT